MDKLCRICWNTNNWVSPSGKVGQLEASGSFAAEHGFGHEEWLFNFNWLLPDYQQNPSTGYHYGFLQPINKFRNKYLGKTFSSFLYTVSPEKEFLIIARIDQLYVPEEDELKWAYQNIRSNGWLAIMKQELADLNLNSSIIDTQNPDSVINVRFRSEDVKFFYPRFNVTQYFKHKKMLRYHPYNWDDQIFSFLEVLPSDYPEEDVDPTRSERSRLRAATNGIEYDPKHVKLQNKLFDWLCSQYGKQAVGYEENFVDLLLHINGKTIFYEIKMENSAKKCIRLALGQLLEYSHFPDQNRAEKLVIVGDMQPTLEDISYLKNLRSLYSMPVYYSRWNWATNSLEPEV